MPTPRTIAIDGPAGAGKSTIGALVAERLGYLFLDTGAMYRAVALAGLRRGIDPDDAPTLGSLAREIRVAIGPPTVRDGRTYTVLLDGTDVTWDIRSAEIDRIVSQVARVPEVRDAMVAQQRTLAERGRVVMVGRDIGTVVLPRADRKVFLTGATGLVGGQLLHDLLQFPHVEELVCLVRPAHGLSGRERLAQKLRRAGVKGKALDEAMS
ncbi:MAG: (d)CMP kinase, partial [Chloroflexota bacterium]